MLGEDGEKRLSLTVDNAILASTSSGYALANRGGDPRQLVVWGRRRGANAGHQGPTQRAVVLSEDGAEHTSAGPARGAARAAAEGPSSEGQQEVRGQDPSAPEGGGMDVEAHVVVALARIMAAASCRLRQRWRAKTQVKSGANGWGPPVRRMTSLRSGVPGRHTRWSVPLAPV